ncbi:MAG: methyltransferase domain-containing protein [Desulfobacteraceae bacterium]|nr:methyltransferase domain-containing protein [Desulfobacteraceae bacterium]
MTMQLFSDDKQDFWEEKWKVVQEKSPFKTRCIRNTNDKVNRWNKMAQWFSKQTSNGDAEKKRNKIISMLEKEGALDSNTRVLDVGAGPGNWAVPLSGKSAHVTALEPAKEMVKLMQEKIEQDKISNISIDQRRWEDVDLEADDMEKKYDLVFASMTPGVNNPATLKKLINASRKFCYLSGFSGQGVRQSYADIWKLFFNEKTNDNSGDIIYPFNLLYSMGYRPKLQFFTWSHLKDHKPDEAIEQMENFLWMYMDITSEVKQKVAKYVEEHSENGIFRQKKDICQGIMLWQVA